MTPIESAIAKVPLPEPVAIIGPDMFGGMPNVPTPVYTRTQFHDFARAVCEELLRGKVLVPVEPTERMLQAGVKAMYMGAWSSDAEELTVLYAAMLWEAARPEADND